MALHLKTAKILVRLINGESIPASAAKSSLIDLLVMENILYKKGKHRKVIELINRKALHDYLVNQLQINSLNDYIFALESENATRADFVKITTDSKDSKERAFKGFLVNSYNPIEVEINKQAMTIFPTLGSFVFIYDYETLKIPENITIIGVENAKNFSQIQEQKYLFKELNPLFISRYPQNQSKDFIKWMQSIPNNYLHFGDFDFAGIGIYLNEYKKHLLDKATFFIPENIEKIIKENGNRQRFNMQKINFKIDEIQESRIIALIDTIKSERKGLDQEFYIEGEKK